MSIADVFARFAVALGIGLLVGLERGWRSREDEPGQRTAGIRTFGLTGLLGAGIAALAQMLGGPASASGGMLLGLGFAAYSWVFATFCRDENRADHRFSVTTAVAGMLVFALAAYAEIGDFRVAAAGGVATAGLLAMREGLHGWLERITWEELRASLVLLTMTFIALPLLPDAAIGPYGGINPREVWLIAIILAAVSFVGYIAMKRLGPDHGVLLGSAAGGLVSSTAVTIASARRVAVNTDASRLFAGGVAAATAVCFLRVVAIVAALKPGLLPLLVPALACATLAALAFALVCVYGSGNGKERQAVEVRNPFSFLPVLGFAIFLAVIIVVSRVIADSLGPSGAIAGAALLGAADVDSVTISSVRLIPEPLSELAGAVAILAAVASNTGGKVVIGVLIARGKFGRQLAMLAALCIGIGGVAFAVTLQVLARLA